MLAVTPHMRVLVAIAPADFRKGIDGLAQECRAVLHANPMSGAIFVFRNRRKTAIKALIFDGQGFWLCQKRLSSGRFLWWPDAPDAPAAELQAHELQVLMSAGDPRSTKAAPPWRSLQPPSTGSTK